MHVHCIGCGATFPVADDMPYVSEEQSAIVVNCETCSRPIEIEPLPTIRQLLFDKKVLEKVVMEYLNENMSLKRRMTSDC